jgi:hypothetical protein
MYKHSLSRAYPQSLTQLVFLIAEGKPKNIAISAFPASAIGGKMTAMNKGVELVDDRPDRVNRHCWAHGKLTIVA